MIYKAYKFRMYPTKEGDMLMKLIIKETKKELKDKDRFIIEY